MAFINYPDMFTEIRDTAANASLVLLQSFLNSYFSEHQLIARNACYCHIDFFASVIFSENFREFSADTVIDSICAIMQEWSYDSVMILSN